MLNGAFVIALGSDFVRERIFAREVPRSSPAAPEPRLMRMVFTQPETVAVAEQPSPPKRFARTTEEQRDERPEEADFIGERDTRAATERTPDTGAPELPSQSGIEPRDEADIETTESNFRDGPLDAADAAPAVPAAPVDPSTPGIAVEVPGEAELVEPSEPSPPVDVNRLLDGPLAVEVPIPPETDAPSQEAEAAGVEAPLRGDAEAKTEAPIPAVADPTQAVPGFRGHQRRTAIRGSISRTGVSSLDVQDNAMGRYQARISRAVELEWQRNCVRHRDFIRPGFLTVRFFVEPSGRVRTVEFVGQMETGEVQKGFTLNSIRNAKIPPMPKELRAELDDEPLELIFNFYF